MFALLIIIFKPVTASAVGTWENSVWVGNGYQTSENNVYIAQKLLSAAGYSSTIGTNTWNKFNSKLILDFAGTNGSTGWYLLTNAGVLDRSLQHR